MEHIVMQSGTRKPKPRGKNPTFFIPKPEKWYPNPTGLLGTFVPTTRKPEGETDFFNTRTQVMVPEPNFCYPTTSLMQYKNIICKEDKTMLYFWMTWHQLPTIVNFMKEYNLYLQKVYFHGTLKNSIFLNIKNGFIWEMRAN